MFNLIEHGEELNITALCVSGKRPACKAVVHRFESGQCLVIDQDKRKVYVREYFVHNADSGWRSEYELFFQPRRDRIRFLLFNAWWNFATRSRFDRVQDWFFFLRHKIEYLDHECLLEMPSVLYDLKHYDLDQKNNTIIGRVEGPRT